MTVNHDVAGSIPAGGAIGGRVANGCRHAMKTKTDSPYRAEVKGPPTPSSVRGCCHKNQIIGANAQSVTYIESYMSQRVELVNGV